MGRFVLRPCESPVTARFARVVPCGWLENFRIARTNPAMTSDGDDLNIRHPRTCSEGPEQLVPNWIVGTSPTMTDHCGGLHA